MPWVIFAALAVLAVSAQTTLAPLIEIAGARPDWPLLLTVFFALRAAPAEALLAAWATGLLVDLSSTAPLGMFAVAYCLAVAILYPVREFILLERLAAFAAVTLPAVLVVYLALGLLRGLAGDPAVTAREAIRLAAGVALYSTAFSPLVHGALRRLGPRWLPVTPTPR